MTTIPRRGLNQNELGVLATFIVASGEWEARGIRRVEAFGALVDVCKTLASGEDVDRTVDGLALSSQNALMAHRRSSFETIQEEPPFRANAIANLKLLTKAWAIGQEESMLERFTALFANQSSNGDGKLIFEVLSGDANTIDSPVRFTDEIVSKVVEMGR